MRWWNSPYTRPKPSKKAPMTPANKLAEMDKNATPPVNEWFCISCQGTFKGEEHNSEDCFLKEDT